MGIVGGVRGQSAGNDAVANLAAKVGLSPEHVESAIAALAKHHPMQGDTAEGAAATTGLPLDKLQEIIGQIGGEGSLGQFAQMIGAVGGEGGEGGAGGLLSGLAGKLFGRG